MESPQKAVKALLPLGLLISLVLLLYACIDYANNDVSIESVKVLASERITPGVNRRNLQPPPPHKFLVTAPSKAPETSPQQPTLPSQQHPPTPLPQQRTPTALPPQQQHPTTPPPQPPAPATALPPQQSAPSPAPAQPPPPTTPPHPPAHLSLRLGYADFWPGFDPTNFFFTNVLSTAFNVSICTSDLDLLIFSKFGTERDNIASKRRIFFTGENLRPDLDAADLSLSFDRLDDPRNLRLPLWVICIDWFGLDNDPLLASPTLLTRTNRTFYPRQIDGITMINSNPSGFRVELWPALVQMLGEQKAVSMGALMTSPNYAPVPGSEKLLAVATRKLHLAIENSVYPGYTTEKILQAYAGNAVPVYHGDPTIGQDFNPRSFLDLGGMSAEEAASAVRDLLSDPLRMDAMLAEPPLEAPLDLMMYIRAICQVAALAVGVDPQSLSYRVHLRDTDR